jgi:hypothetical protein
MAFLVLMGCFDSYPWWMIFLSNLVSVGVYILGGLILLRASWMWLIPYALFVLWLEVRLMMGSCTICYYYAKQCAFGRGRLASIFFKKGDEKKFGRKKVCWRDILPDFLIAIIPIVFGVVLLIRGFTWILLGLVLLLLLFAFIGNGLVRGLLACKHCKQKELGCPAEKLFNKQN